MKERKKSGLSAPRGKKQNGKIPPSLRAGSGADLSIKEFLSELGRTDVVEFEYERKDLHIVIRKEPVDTMLGEEPEIKEPQREKAGSRSPAPEKRKEKKILKSPAVGTFYLVENDRPLVSAGESVKKGKKLGWVNSMGIAQDIAASTACKIVSILCADSSVVEWGQSLFEIEES